MAPVLPAIAPKAAFVISPKVKTKVSNVDVVNRNMDRTEMTIAVEYQYSKDDAMPKMGVDLASSEEPGAAAFFSSPPVDIGKGSRSFVMFPVKLNPSAAQKFNRSTLPTDKVWIYLMDASGAKSYVAQSTMILVWHIPGAGADAASSQNTVEIESFKQNDLFSGYVSVKYLTAATGAQLRLKVYDSAKPATVAWFESEDLTVKPGPGVQLVKTTVSRNAKSPDVFTADTIEVDMLDANGKVTASVKKQSSMTWAKPK